MWPKVQIDTRRGKTIRSFFTAPDRRGGRADGVEGEDGDRDKRQAIATTTYVLHPAKNPLRYRLSSSRKSVISFFVSGPFLELFSRRNIPAIIWLKTTGAAQMPNGQEER